MVIAGREKEINILQQLLLSNYPEFVAVYGRRRVGKTFLIREVYKEHLVFECAGLHKKSFSQQLENCINLFEIKFHDQTFNITKSYADQLQKKVRLFKDQTQTPKNVFLSFLTVYGVTKNKYYLSIVSNQLFLEDLFRKPEVIR